MEGPVQDASTIDMSQFCHPYQIPCLKTFLDLCYNQGFLYYGPESNYIAPTKYQPDQCERCQHIGSPTLTFDGQHKSISTGTTL